MRTRLIVLHAVLGGVYFAQRAVSIPASILQHPSQMAARAAVRASYANVLRAQRVVFRDDMRASSMARERTKQEYLKHRDVTDPAEVGQACLLIAS
jgi:hypothetical protein